MQLRYQRMDDQTARLVWDMAIDVPNHADYWSLRVDALNGEVLDKNNYTVYCQHEHSVGASCHNWEEAATTAAPLLLPNDGATYNVFPFPVESPVHGARALLVNPADSIASPFGWHDTNGMAGAEFTITRGNNVHAFPDTLNVNESRGGEPSGGNTLFFDFPFSLDQEPEEHLDFSTTQLFYANNYIHDFTYAYGFDEAAGNFQQNNYGRGGRGADYVSAQSQDGGGTNNANFATPPDGSSGQMQMYLWNRNNGLLNVTEPSAVVGVYETRTAEFGAAISTTAVTGEVTIVDDASGQPTFGCNPIQNDLTGKIALIDRGGCFFSIKAFNAEQAGAIGVIICNFDGGAFSGMSAGSNDRITIPSVMIQYSDCVRLRAFADRGLIVSLVQPQTDGPSQVDGTLDNGIVAHEYGHGISNRLTGGPSQAGCLINDEQMGEGWSDFFSLVTTVKPEDVGTKARGIGTFAQNQDPNSNGIRRFPYSISQEVNPQTLLDIVATTSPHGLGEIWTTVLWDLYWTMVEQYGFDPDLINGKGGNNLAVQLVMDGMKLQACNPGFLDGRDAILKADIANNEGANQCLIWEVFARRGLGWDALQRDNNNRNDNKEGFLTRPDCIKELKIEKQMTDEVQAGDTVTVTLLVINHKDTPVSKLNIQDSIPAGTRFSKFINTPETVTSSDNSSYVSFEVGELLSGDSLRLVYQLLTDAEKSSVSIFMDDMEGDDSKWNYFPLDEGLLIWLIVEEAGVEGSSAWYVTSDRERPQDQVLETLEPILITGEQPVLRFTHQFDTEWGFDGGFIQVSTNGTSWTNLESQYFRNGYETTLSYNTISIPNLNAFAGTGMEFRTSYVDLSQYIGEQLYVRFRFGSDAEVESFGWIVDNIEVMDMINYNSTACVFSAEGDMACTIAQQRGTVVTPSAVTTSTTATMPEAISLQVYPNPTSTSSHVLINTVASGEMVISVIGMDGKIHTQQKQYLQAGYNYFPLETSHLTDGFYFVKIESDWGSQVEKLIKN
ncbi:MAG: T9SS type A sorting domain-containing protein [Saprospiraceae bacterium]|nr:T9SS type A sorting domain-containing protein [Saprospiraceae bacterium]